MRDLATGKIKSKVIKNTAKGHEEMVGWLLKTTKAAPVSILVTMEATGVYHEVLAECLYEAGFKVIVSNPGKAKEFAKSQNQQGKTDKKDSVMLARYGQSSHFNLRHWKPESLEGRQLKAMVRRLAALEKDRQRELNRLEASEFNGVSQRVIQSINDMVTVLDMEIEKLQKDIDDHISGDPQMYKDRQLLLSIKGVGNVVSRELLSLFSSKKFLSGRQASAYLGIVPIHHESGALKGRSTMSKRGPGRLRAKLYMAAVVACPHNPQVRAQYLRLLKNGKTKMQAICAAMRKLVEICFGVVKHQREYQPQMGLISP